MAVRKPRVGEERRRCSEMLFVVWRWVRSEGSERLAGFVRSIVDESVKSVSVIQAMRSRIQRTEPASKLITSKELLDMFMNRICDVPGSSRGDSGSLFTDLIFIFAAIVTTTTIFRN